MDYSKIYTDAPKQHPNLILGSLQLLFWLFFRPKAWRNHLEYIDSQWDNSKLQKLLAQIYIIIFVFTVLLILTFLLLAVDDVTMAVAVAVAGTVAGGVALAVALAVAGGVAGGVAGDAAGGVAVAVTGGVAVAVGATINLWRPVLIYPFLTLFHILLYGLDQRNADNKLSFLHWHSAFWDEYQFMPFIGLDRHLVQVIKRNPDEGKAAIEYLLSNNRQSWAVQAAQIELDAQMLERSAEVESIRKVYHELVIEELQGKANPILGRFTRISEDVDAALNQRSNYNQRLALTATADRLNANLQDLTRSSNKYAPRFRPIAKKWRGIITNYVEELAKQVELRQEIDSPYILAVPLTQEQEIFSGRDDIGSRIEQLILDRRRPPLLLYGQRRMGKTSLLYNLGKLLPNSIIPMFVDLQGAPSSAKTTRVFSTTSPGG